jgi:hypothetical protein
MRRLLALTLLLGCERAEPDVAAPVVIAPDAPAPEAMRSSSTANDPPPPPRAAPLGPAMPPSLQRWFVALAPSDKQLVRQYCQALRENPCAGVAPRKRAPDEPPDPVLAFARGDHGERADEFCSFAGARGRCNTPLVVAFDGQPIELLTTPKPFAFRPGEPVATDWPTAATPWLALDRDGDGAITSGLELFGDAGGAKNGFEALAALDDNRDGVIDRADAAFAQLLLWADANGDRESTPAELSPLARTVTSIPLTYEADARCTRGNCEGERGRIEWRDANGPRTGAVVDIYLRVR